jgi:hypothetical protein
LRYKLKSLKIRLRNLQKLTNEISACSARLLIIAKVLSGSLDAGACSYCAALDNERLPRAIGEQECFGTLAFVYGAENAQALSDKADLFVEGSSQHFEGRRRRAAAFYARLLGFLIST